MEELTGDAHVKFIETIVKQACKNGWMGEFVALELQTNQWIVTVNIKKRKCRFAFCSTYDIIFNHDFSICFWGDKPWDGETWTPEGDSGTIEWPRYEWQWRLQQLVLKTKPLNYFQRYLNELKNG